MNTAQTVNFDIPIEEVDIPMEPEEQIEDWSEYDNYEFKEGEIFIDEYPPQLADWCDNHQTSNEIHTIVEIEPDENGKRRFKYVINRISDEELAQNRQKLFYNNFIVTSWGAFRKAPRGYSSAVEAVNTVFNMVNIAQGLNESLAPLLIFYEVPDFTDPEQCTEEWLVANQKTHEPCDLATFMQWYLEFQTVWAQTQYTSQEVPLSL